MSTTTMEPWRHTLRSTHAYGQLCFAVDDFSYFEGRVALQEKAPLLYRTQFRNIDKQQDGIGRYGFVPSSHKSFAGLNNSKDIEGIKAVADESAQEVTRLTKNFAANLETEIKTKPSDKSELPAWKEKLKRKNQEHKDALTKMMDDSMNKAMDRIEKLPEEMREPAADRYTSAWDYLMVAIMKIKEFLDKAWTAIVDLWTSIVHGVQVWIEGAVSTIKEWAGDALSRRWKGLKRVYFIVRLNMKVRRVNLVIQQYTALQSDCVPDGKRDVTLPVTWPKGGWPVASQVRGRMTGLLPLATRNVSGEGLFAGEADVVDFVPGSSIPKHFNYWRTPAKPESFTISPKNKPNTLRLTASSANLTGKADFKATDGLTLVMRRQAHTLFNYTVDAELLGASAQDGDEVGVTSFLDQYQHVDLGVVYMSKNKKISPYLRFRATTFGKTNFTGTVPQTNIVALPSDWSNDLVRLGISSINDTHFAFVAAPAARPSCSIVVGVANTTLVSGPGNASGGLLGAYATTNGANRTVQTYISRWRYTPVAQEVDYSDFVYSE